MDLKTFLPTLRRTTALRPQPIPAALMSPYPEMSRVFEDIFSAIARAPWANGVPQALTTARVQVGETDKDISIITELPGLSEQDVEVLLDDDLLTVRAEKKSESSSGREYGVFLRSFRLPFSPDPAQVDAVLENGLLTICIAKPAVVRDTTRNITVRPGDSTPPEKTQPANAAADSTGAAKPQNTAGASEQGMPQH
jgi:HSP20 family protein